MLKRLFSVLAVVCLGTALFAQSGSSSLPFWFSPFSNSNSLCSDTLGNTEGYGFIAPRSGTFRQLWVYVMKADSTPGDNYQFSILKPTSLPWGGADLSLLGSTTAGPTGSATGPVSLALNQNITLAADQEYVLACSVSAGDSAQFSGALGFQTFPSAVLSSAAFPASGYSVPAFQYTIAPTGIAYTLSAAANASGGNTVYTGTRFGSTNSLAGFMLTVAGFTNSANNGKFLVSANTATTLTLANASGVAETHAATGVYSIGVGIVNFGLTP